MGNFKERCADLDLIYKTANGLKLPIQVFLPDADVHKSQAVLAIHGGGWNDAIKDNSKWNGSWMAKNAKYLAERGFIGIIISYRSLKVSDELNVNDLLKDCEDALRYIKEHLKFVSFNNFVCMGDSAGGYFATMLGLSQDDSIRPKAVVALNPVLGLLDSKWKYGFENCSDINSLTPINCVGRKSADFLFIHGTSDDVVDIEFTKELNDLLTSMGHNSEFVEIENARHAFILYDYQYPDEYVTRIMERIISYIMQESNE